MTEEKLLILPLSDKNSKKISQVLANETSRKILEALCDESLSSSQISERLKAPLTTLHYNIEHLLEIGLIKVERIKYSPKGREVKYYAPTRKFIVIAPEDIGKEEIKSTLRKALFGIYFMIAAVGSGYAFQRIYYSIMGFGKPLVGMEGVARAPIEKAAEEAMEPAAAPIMDEAANYTITEEAVEKAAETKAPIITEVLKEPNLYLWFLFGAVFALVLLFAWKKLEGRMKWKTKG